MERDDKAKSQPIHYAAAFDRFNFIEYFTQHSIDINTKNSEGSTPLHIAGKKMDPARECSILTEIQLVGDISIR